MGLERNFRRLMRSLDRYQEMLGKYSDAQFAQQPAEGKWSLAQVYAHIMTANLLSVKGMIRVLDTQPPPVPDRLKWSARYILLWGKIPAGRKVPQAVQDRTPVFDKPKALEAILRLREQLQAVYSRRKEWNPRQKFRHPVLGYLDNRQWVRFMQIHTEHHYRQLLRTEKQIGI